jgi:hypothetical protein
MALRNRVVDFVDDYLARMDVAYVFGVDGYSRGTSRLGVVMAPPRISRRRS